MIGPTDEVTTDLINNGYDLPSHDGYCLPNSFLLTLGLPDGLFMVAASGSDDGTANTTFHVHYPNSDSLDMIDIVMREPNTGGSTAEEWASWYSLPLNTTIRKSSVSNTICIQIASQWRESSSHSNKYLSLYVCKVAVHMFLWVLQ